MANYLVITGASAGIGLATAALFLEKGFAVVNLSRRPCPLAQVQNFQVDLTDSSVWADLTAPLQQAVAAADRIILIHNAALLLADTVETVAAETLRAMLEVNLVAPTILNRIYLPLMQPGSAIIYVGSTLAEKGVPGQLSYVTSKHGQVGLMRATCQDLMGKHKIIYKVIWLGKLGARVERFSSAVGLKKLMVPLLVQIHTSWAPLSK